MSEEAPPYTVGYSPANTALYLLAGAVAAQINATLRPHEQPVAADTPEVLAVAAGLLELIRPAWNVVTQTGYGETSLTWQEGRWAQPHARLGYPPWKRAS